MLTPQQKDLLRHIGSGTMSKQRYFPKERQACTDMAFGRPRLCKCYACERARVNQAEAVARYGNNLPYQIFPLGKKSRGMR